jgi:hypothetical protein
MVVIKITPLIFIGLYQKGKRIQRKEHSFSLPDLQDLLEAAIPQESQDVPDD